MKRPAGPPRMEFFAAPRPPGGDFAIGITLGDLRIEIRALSREMAERLHRRYAPFSDLWAGADGGSGRPAIQVRLGLEDLDYFIPHPPRAEVNPVLIECDGARVRYLGHRLAGWFDIGGGRGEILLARGDWEPLERAVENYVRTATAWLAADSGGALVHAASAAWKGRGYLFFGPSGAGKSTLSACNQRALVLSDDLSLVRPSPGGGLDVVGTPFRGTYEGGEPVTGRFPLVAGFRIIKADRARVRDASRARLFAGLAANLPFIIDAFPTRPDLFRRMEETFASLPLYLLDFRKDDSYWDAVEAAGL